MNNKLIWSAVVVVAIIAIIGTVTPIGKQVVSLGSLPTNYDIVQVLGQTSPTQYTIQAGATGAQFGIAPVRQTMTSATTTVCSFISPAATSSVIALGVNITTGTSTVTTWTIATSTNGYATTSKLTSFTVASGAQYNFNWSAPNDQGVIAPNTFLNVSVAGGVINGASDKFASVSGSCQALIVSEN